MKIKVLNALKISMIWLLPQVILGQIPNLGTTADFALFTAAGSFDNVGVTSITGDIGTNSGALKGFAPGFVFGQTHLSDPVAAQAAQDLDRTYNYLNALTCGKVIGTELGKNQTLTPNVYCLGAPSTLTGYLTLDAQNNPNAVFIFKIEGTLTATAASHITLINGASVENIFWLIKGTFVQSNNAVFKGNIIANGAISLSDGAMLLGRALTRQGGISLQNNFVSTTLPIDLVYFNAQKQDNTVSLNWATVTEHNIVNIELQRSYNARDFETLTSFISTGKVSDKNVYYFLDKNPFEKVENPSANMVFYRVKQVDFNHTFTYSKVIAVSKETTDKVNVYETPSSYQIVAKSVANAQPFSITNLSGQVMSSGQYTATNALDISHLPAGFYSLNIQSMNIRFLKN